MLFSQKYTFAMSIRGQPNPENANCDEYTHSRWHQFAMKAQFTSNLRTGFGTDWRSNTLISAQNHHSRATCPLVLAHVGAQIVDRYSDFSPKPRFSSNLSTGFGTDWRSNTLISAQNHHSRAKIVWSYALDTKKCPQTDTCVGTRTLRPASDPAAEAS